MSSGVVLQQLARVRQWLATVDAVELDDEEQRAVIAQLEAIKAAAAGAQARAIVCFATGQRAEVERALRERAAEHAAEGLRQQVPVTRRRIDQIAARSVAGELGLACRMSPARASAWVRLSHRMVGGDLVATGRALQAGELSEEKSRIIGREIAVLTAQPVQERLDWASIAELERGLAELGARLPARDLERAAKRAVAEADARAVVASMERAVGSRRVTIRPAADGMALLSVVGPMVEVVGAYAALKRRVAGSRAAAELGEGAAMCDAALEVLSGRAPGEAQPVTITVVLPASSLRGAAGVGPALVPGVGALPAGALDNRTGRHTVRRVWSDPVRGMVALESRGRAFEGGLREFVELRDQVCRTPHCGAPIRHLDHVRRHADGGPTSAANGQGLCARCNLAKEAPGWRHRVVSESPHTVEITTPTGARYLGQAPPVQGWGAAGSYAVERARTGT